MLTITINEDNAEGEVESLTLDEMAGRARAREPFHTPQVWGYPLNGWAYAIGSSGMLNDSGRPTLSAIVGHDGSVLMCSPLANPDFLRTLLGKGIKL